MTDKKPGWATVTTDVQPNSLIISGYKLDEIIANATLLETAHLLVTTELPTPDVLEAHRKAAIQAALLPSPPIERFAGEAGQILLMEKTKGRECGYGCAIVHESEQQPTVQAPIETPHWCVAETRRVRPAFLLP